MITPPPIDRLGAGLLEDLADLCQAASTMYDPGLVIGIDWLTLARSLVEDPGEEVLESIHRLSGAAGLAPVIDQRALSIATERLAKQGHSVRL